MTLPARADDQRARMPSNSGPDPLAGHSVAFGIQSSQSGINGPTGW